jgi:hypothetical protein
VRRLTTAQLANLAAERGFRLEREIYANQYHGSLSWITAGGPKLVCRLFDPSNARSEAERTKLRRRRWRLLVPSAFRMLSSQVQARLAKPHKSSKDKLLLLAATPFYVATRPLTRALDAGYDARAQAEWDTRRTERCGSEMYLSFRRGR